MKKSNKLIFILSIMFLSIAFSACSSGDKGKSGKVEIEFFSQKKEMQQTLSEIIKDFEKENPDIRVKLTSVPDPGTVLKTRIASKEIPDVINIFPQNTDFQEWAKEGIFENLTDKDYLSNLKEGAAETYAIDGEVYSVPLTSNAWGFFYNKDKFDDLGITPPETWNEFEKLVKNIQEKDETPFALSLTQADAWTLNGYHQLAWATVNEGYEGAQNALRRSGKGAIKVTNKDFSQVVYELDLLNGTGQKNAQGASYDDAITAFVNQEALIFPNGIWALPAIQNHNPNFEIRMFAYPGLEKGKQLTVGAADLALSISKSTKHKEAANKFLEYMTTKEAMQKYYDVDGAPTSVKAVDTEGKFPQTEGVTQYVFTDKQIVWLQKEWTSEERFHHMTVEYINSGDKSKYAENLNDFFDSMK